MALVISGIRSVPQKFLYFLNFLFLAIKFISKVDKIFILTETVRYGPKIFFCILIPCNLSTPDKITEGKMINIINSIK